MVGQALRRRPCFCFPAETQIRETTILPTSATITRIRRLKVLGFESIFIRIFAPLGVDFFTHYVEVVEQDVTFTAVVSYKCNIIELYF